MKKILLGLGTIAAVVAPVATTVSCFGYGKGPNNYQTDFTVLINTLEHKTTVQEKREWILERFRNVVAGAFRSSGDGDIKYKVKTSLYVSGGDDVDTDLGIVITVTSDDISKTRLIKHDPDFVTKANAILAKYITPEIYSKIIAAVPTDKTI